MTRAQERRFRKLLQQRRAELLGGIKARQDVLQVEYLGDPIDRVRQVAERELAVRNLERVSAMLKSVEGALKEIEEGTFGVCASCGKPIPVKRLEVVPGRHIASNARRVPSTLNKGRIAPGPSCTTGRRAKMWSICGACWWHSMVPHGPRTDSSASSGLSSKRSAHPKHGGVLMRRAGTTEMLATEGTEVRSQCNHGGGPHNPACGRRWKASRATHPGSRQAHDALWGNLPAH